MSEPEWPDVIGSGGKASSEPQEWTEDYVRQLSQISSGDGFLRIANSRNAAIAAEREQLQRIDDFFRDPNGSFMVEGNSALERVKNYTQELDAQIDAERKLRKPLVEALEQLMDHQNGCPLPKYEKGWTHAMQLASAALAQAKEGEQ